MQTSDRVSRCHPNEMAQKASEQNATLKNMNFQEKFIECNKTRRVSEQIITTLTRPLPCSFFAFSKNMENDSIIKTILFSTWLPLSTTKWYAAPDFFLFVRRDRILFSSFSLQ